MHRSSQCSRTRCIPRLGRTVYGRHSRPFTNASARYVVDNDGQEKEDLFSWEEHHAEEVGRRPGDTQGVITSDLPATLEAHRARNRASVIRRIDAPSKTPRSIHRPPIETSHNDGKGSSGPPTRSRALSSNDGKGNVKSIKVKQKLEEAKASMPMWPADSTQFITRYGDGKKKGIRMTRTGKYVKSNEVLEYTGTPLSPNRSWSWRANVAPLLQRPWLAYMEESSGDKTKRFVIALTSPITN